MNRVKSFTATGVPPSGVLYAGDLNGIQDAAAAQADLTQVIQTGSLVVGESGLQLLRYGAGEAALTGDLRVYGLLRGLGGISAGAFSTSQRDAIPTGKAPYTIVIFNTSTNRYEYNAGSDSIRNWQPLAGPAGTVPLSQIPVGTVGYLMRTILVSGVPTVSWDAFIHGSAHLPTGSDPIDSSLVHRADVWANRGSPAVYKGTFFFATDINGGQLFQADGSNWIARAPGISQVGASNVTTLPGSPVDGQEVYLNLASGIVWHLKYDISLVGNHPWKYIGGPPLYAAGPFASGGSTSAAQITVPYAGIYDAEAFASGHGTGDNTLPVILNRDGHDVISGSSRASDSSGFGDTVTIKERLTGVVSTIKASTGANFSFGEWTTTDWLKLFVTPVNIG